MSIHFGIKKIKFFLHQYVAFWVNKKNEIRSILGVRKVGVASFQFFFFSFSTCPLLSGLKNTQDQIIHLQHIIQLLPLINRDTLYVLLQFLGLVAENAEDRSDDAGKS